MAMNYEMNSAEGSVSYSARRGRPPEDITRAPAIIEKKSPVWPLAAVVFATGFLQNDFWFAVACVLAQLSVMTSVQWLVMFTQQNANILGLKPFRTLPALKVARIGVFACVIACILMLG